MAFLMKSLTPQFGKSGFQFNILLREGNVALLRKTKLGFSFESFEVVRIQRHNGYQIAGKKIPPAEMMPSSYNWGTHGWTFTSYDAACVKFNQLKDKQSVLTKCLNFISYCPGGDGGLNQCWRGRCLHHDQIGRVISQMQNNKLKSGEEALPN
jgi:hypothetical protein